MLEQTTKILDASSGESTAFRIKDETLLFKLSISGTPGANVKAFLCQSQNDQQFLKINCSSWSGASVALLAHTGHADDSYSASGVVFTEDTLEIHFFN